MKTKTCSCKQSKLTPGKMCPMCGDEYNKEIEDKDKKTLRIVYQPDENYCVGDGVTEALAWHTYEQFLKENINTEMNVSSFLFINCIRTLIAEGKINHQHIEFEYNGEILTVNEYGVLNRWPDNFGDLELDLAGRILRAQRDKRKGLTSGGGQIGLKP